MKEDYENLLDRVQIASPCSAKWEEMEGDDRSRFCNLCSLNVYNLSTMSKSEATAFLIERMEGGQRVCANLFRRQDGTILTDNCPVGLRKIRDAAKLLRARVASVVGVLFSLILPAKAQVAEESKQPRATRGEVFVRPVAGTQGSTSTHSPQMELGKIAIPVRTSPPGSPNSGGRPVRRDPPISLNVKGSLISHSTAFYSNQCNINSSAIRAVSSASLDSANNERELETALTKLQQTSNAAMRSCAAAKDCEQVKVVHALEAAISLTAEGNCLYYLGRAAEATSKYENALRQIEDVSFERKPAVVDKIFGNLNQAKRLEKAHLDSASLKEKRGSISVSFSERGPSSGGIAWLGSDDGKCEFTDPLI